MSKVAKVKKYDVANGVGIRTSVFFSGCTHCCKNCFNQELWSFDVGVDFDREFYETKIKPTINEHIAGISILGGEPLHQNNVDATSNLVDWFKQDFPNKSIWIWSGYTWDEIMNSCNKGENDNLNWLICSVDVLVDGKFIEEQKDLSLKWCGSKNQRVIDVQKTLEQGEVVLYER